MTTRHDMTGWYSPPMLARTGLRVLISTLFGQFADRRIALAAASEIAPQPFDAAFDYAGEGGEDGFWFDFVADTGDGWDSTFAIARLLAEDRLDLAGEQPLPRGRLVVMGGDQVYPVASMEAYEERLVAPYDLAALNDDGTPRWPQEAAPHLYAIPGNHDWYDGLNAFLALFCRRRIASATGLGTANAGKRLGGRITRQTRSYFALRLPGNWWLWATDSQLEGYIDQPQLDYFRHAASHWMDPGANVILCTGTPDWEYADPRQVKQTFDKFAYLERLAGTATDADGKPMNHRLRLALSGDSHHYAHYAEDDRHYVTCGGGGAFLHPTHHRDDTVFDANWPKPGEPAPADGQQGHYPRDLRLQAVYPDKATSRRLTWGNLFFAIRNPGFVLFLAIAYGLFLWMLEARTGQGSLLARLHGLPLLDATKLFWSMVFSGPGPASLFFLSIGAYWGFADAETPGGRVAMGGLHAIAQTAVATLTVYAVLRLWPCPQWPVLALIVATLVAAIAAATCFGTYLLIALDGFRRHWDEAFSSLASPHYKSFLRLRIDRDGGLTVFPVGLDHTPRDREAKRPTLTPKLIEPGFEV